MNNRLLSVLIPGTIVIIAIGAVFYLKENTSEQETPITKSTNQITQVMINKEPTASQDSDKTNGVSLPLAENVLRSFIQLIGEKRAADAINYLSPNLVGDENTKQAWGVQFNAINSIKILSLNPPNSQNLKDNRITFKVTLDVKMDPSSADTPIPYYGWGDGENIRWITVEKTNNIWRIASIATGP